MWQAPYRAKNAGRGNIGQMFSLEQFRWQADGEVCASPFAAQGRDHLDVPPLEPLRMHQSTMSFR
jgi:hypothetical protein